MLSEPFFTRAKKLPAKRSVEVWDTSKHVSSVPGLVSCQSPHTGETDRSHTLASPNSPLIGYQI